MCVSLKGRSAGGGFPRDCDGRRRFFGRVEEAFIGDLAAVFRSGSCTSYSDILLNTGREGSTRGFAGGGNTSSMMAEVNSPPLDAIEREPRWVSPQGSEEVCDERAAPAYAQDMEELEATQGYKRDMLDDAASSVSFRKGGAPLPRAAQVYTSSNT